MSDRVPVSEAEDKLEVSTEDNAKAQTHPVSEGTLSYMDDIEYHRMADFMGLDYESRKDSQMAEKLSYLYDWAQKSTGSDKRVDNFMALKAIWRGMGMNTIGSEMVKGLYKWTRLDAQRQKIEERMKTVSING